MGNIIKQTNDFLREISMHPDLTDISAVTNDIISEMGRGLRSKNSSLKMIPTFISANGTPRDNESVIAVDAGGTNLRVALVTFQNGKPQVSHLTVYPIPGCSHEISADEFFHEIAQKIIPLIEFSDKIGFCFSYPAEIFPDRDGKILQLSKGVCVTGAEGLVIGYELKKKLRELGVSKTIAFTLLNDTVASLMGGAAEFPIKDYDGMCGLILGTGFNTCYPEKGEKIKKLNGAGDMIINCETGDFSKGIRGKADEMTDAATENPGFGLCEKMTSGAYNGWVITNTAILASNKGLLSEAFSTIDPHFTSLEVDEFLRGEDNRLSKMCVGADAEVLCEIADNFFERAAKLICASIAALCLHCDGGKSLERPFCVIAEGSTFYKSLLIKDKLEKYVKSYIEGELSRFIVFKKTENSTLTGAALAVLLS